MRLSFLGWAILCIFSTLVCAAAPTAPSVTADELCAQDTACRQHAENAQNLSTAGKLSAALDEYQAAYQAIQIPVFLYNIARLYHRTGNTEQAAIYYQRYLAAGHLEDADHRARAQEYLKQIDSAAPPRDSQKDSTLALSIPATEAKPVYKKWWFWTIAGTVVAGTAIGLGVGLGMRNQGLPGDVMIYNPGF